MPPFRFRAAAALDLRQKQEDEARVAHADAERASLAADARVIDARDAAARAADVSTATEREGADAWLISWHRSWITKLRLETDARQREAAISAAAADRAAASMRDAHQRRLALERLRDRGLRRHHTAGQRRELQEMNLLAGLRYLGQAADEGGDRE